MVNRTLTVIAVVLAFVLAGGSLILYLAYGLESDVARRQVVAGLSETAEVGWTRSGVATIAAADEADAYAALGFVHGARHAWPLALWRQTATGRLAAWFGNDLLVVDQLVRQLGLGELSRTAFAQLPPEDRQLLEAYAAGVNAAFDGEAASLRDEMVLFDVRPDPWEAWHTLAVERLFAWLATTPPAPDSLAYAGEDAVQFRVTDRLLRGWLHMHGFENGLAWTAADSSGTHFYQRHVYGASALPLFQEVALTVAGEPTVSGATLLGTPFFPAGRTATRSWALLYRSDADFVRTVRDTTEMPITFDRVVSPDGAEHLLAVQRDQRGIFFERQDDDRGAGTRPETDTTATGADTSAVGVPAVPTATRPDSAWVLRWTGFRPVTDWHAWRALQRGDGAAFELLDGSGLVMDASGTARVLGAPAVVAGTGSGVLVSNSPWGSYAAARLDSLLDGPAAGIQRLVDDVRSPWAARVAPPLVRAASAVPDQPELVRDALTFLRNWDYSYDQASIAASIFDTWVGRYRDSLGTLPIPEVPDSLLSEPITRYRLLVQTVDTLAARFGDNLSQWRWENVQPRRYYFPAFSEDTLTTTSRGMLPRSRYAPLDLPGRGHPSTVAWGPSPVQGRRPAPAAWEGWVNTSSWNTMHVRRYLLDTRPFLGRYLISDRLPPVFSLAPDVPRYRTTTLVPASRETSE